MKKSTKWFLVGAGVTVTALLGVAVSLKERENTFFECPHCGEEFSPELTEYILAPHTPNRKKLKCPICGNSAWAKKVSMIDA